MKKAIIYFDRPGPQNTEKVIKAVKERIEKLGIKHVVVASESGKTAIKVAKALKKLNLNIVCVTAYAGVRSTYEKELGRSYYLSKERREELKKLGVKVLEESRWIFFGAAFDYAFLGDHAPSTAIHRFISRVMGYGFKVAIEITLIAADVGAIPSEKEVVAIAGTGWVGGGADCALVIKPSLVHRGRFLDPKKGLEVREIIAIPRLKFSTWMEKNIRREKI